MATALVFLSKCLQKYHHQNVIILIDEYDVPLENSYFRGFYQEMVDFIPSLFESALKTKMPWSIINYVDDAIDGEIYPHPYWSNTSSNDIVRHLVDRADPKAKEEIEQREIRCKPLSKKLNMCEIQKQTASLPVLYLSHQRNSYYSERSKRV